MPEGEEANAEEEALAIEGLPEEITEDMLAEILAQLLEKYADSRYPFEIRKVARGYQFFTKNALYPFVRRAGIMQKRKRLTKAALETLSIIAYRQPVAKAELEFIRGVNCDYAVQKLLDKKLIDIIGRSDAPGRPLLYGTSEFFMQYFGISDLTDLPKLKEFEASAEEHLEFFRQHQEAQQTDNGEETNQGEQETAGEET
jgi:segregation and condensation protein B